MKSIKMRMKIERGVSQYAPTRDKKQVHFTYILGVFAAIMLGMLLGGFASLILYIVLIYVLGGG